MSRENLCGVITGIGPLWVLCSPFLGHLLGCGLAGGSNCTTTIDCSDLTSDFAARLSSGEDLDQLFTDLHYGLLAEVDEVINWLRVQLHSTMEVAMNNQIGRSNSPQPTSNVPPTR